MHNLNKLIREVLESRLNKQDCGCGCSGKCSESKAPVINENLIRKPLLSEHLQYHVDNKKPLTENTFRYGSEAFLNLWSEARKLYSRNLIEVSGLDKDIIVETDLGEYGIFEGQKVPLDLPMVNEVEDNSGFNANKVWDFIESRPFYNKSYMPKFNTAEEIWDEWGSEEKQMYAEFEWEDTYGDKLHPREKSALQRRANYDKLSGLNEAEYQGKKVQLNKPKRGGSKKFYVYVMDPKTKRVKKVSFGAAGGGQNLAVKIRDPKARRAFAKRQNCDKKKDRTKPGYWSCSIGRYWKSLGGEKNFSGYW